MRVRLLFLLTFSTVISASLGFAQADARQPVVQVRDGGTSGRMESIFIPPQAGAPFSLTLVTEWSRPLANGGTFTLANRRRIMRDGKGRIYQERWILVPKDSKIQSRMDVFQITDPMQHTWYNCGVEGKVCELFPYAGSTETVYKPMIGASGALPDNTGFRQREDLGLRDVGGVETTGYRETTTINAGALGNDQPMVTTREFWYSAQLGINLISKVDDPQNGKQVFTVTDLTTTEPDLTFFDLPEGFKIVDRSKE